MIDVQYYESCVDEEVNNKELEITTCALFGTLAPPYIKTMKVIGFVKNCSITILIDSGGSHNFVNYGLIKRVKGNIDTMHTFNVEIADGDKVSTQGTLVQIPVII